MSRSRTRREPSFREWSLFYESISEKGQRGKPFLEPARRHHLTEDLAQIQRYFPGARPVVLRTPFDLTPKPRRITVAMFREEPTIMRSWRGKLRWTI